MRAWFVVFAVAACGSGAGTGDDDDQPDAAVDAPGDAVDASWTTLIERSWQLNASSEDFKCIRMKVPTEMYISGFRVSSPVGTHHEILTVTEVTSPVGPYDCDGSNLDLQMLFAGGIATDDIVFPTGVAIKLPANTYINLNLHVSNYSDQPITGTSGIQIKTVPASQVVHEADMMFLGKQTLNIPANTLGWTESSSCSIPVQWTMLNLWPHMHSYAKHQKVTNLNGSNQLKTLLDADYSYMDQKYYPMTVPLAINDQLQIDCTYDNPTNSAIVYGQNAGAEMCMAGFYKYPAGGDKYLCAPLQ
jgi:hypothetical protein